MAVRSVAMTAYVLTYEARCDAGRFTFAVANHFLPHESWVKPFHLMQPTNELTLQHERTHFDLSEVQARRARQALAALPAPCDLSNEERDKLVQPLLTQGASVQEQYDRETDHGTLLDRQRHWQSQVQRWLTALTSASARQPVRQLHGQ